MMSARRVIGVGSGRLGLNPRLSTFLFANAAVVDEVANAWSDKAREAALIARKMKVGGMSHEDHDATAQAVERRAKQYQANSLKDVWDDVADAHHASSKALKTSSVQDHYSASVYHHRAAESMKLIGDTEKAKSHSAMAGDHDKILEKLDPEAKTKVKHPDMEERLTGNSVSLSAGTVDDFVTFTNEQAPIQAANAETRLRKVMLAPYGDWPNSRGLQRFQKVDAEEIVKEFSNVVNRLINPASWLGLPWYEGHPDHPDFRGKPGHTRATAVGRIKSLEAGDDGLYANVRFNEDGERLISNESYHGHSVNWFLTRDKMAANAFRPFRLKSVGFTNEPNIPVPAVTTANAWSDKAREAALLARKEHAVSLSAKANAESEAAKNAGNPQASHTIAKHAHLEAAAAHADAMDDIDSPTSDDFKQHQKLAAWHRRAADRHLRMKHPDQSMNPKPTLNKLREKVGWSNSSPVSRFRAMAQMREMANGAPMGNKNAAGHSDWLKAQSDYNHPLFGKPAPGTKTATCESCDHKWPHNPHADFRGCQKCGGIKFKLSANSQSRFAVMRGMREVANGAPVGNKNASGHGLPIHAGRKEAHEASMAAEQDGSLHKKAAEIHSRVADGFRDDFNKSDNAVHALAEKYHREKASFHLAKADQYERNKV